MIRIEFSEQDLKQIQQLRYEHAHPRVRRRMEALWLKSQGLEHQEICRLAGLSSNTLRKYLRLFQAGGIKKLTELNRQAHWSAIVINLRPISANIRPRRSTRRQQKSRS